MNNTKQPFESLGRELKKLRNQRQESLIEVSGAVEIESDELSKYEEGKSRPSEEILALLISYFDIKESESKNLWKLAGYENVDSPEGFTVGDDLPFQTQQIMVMPMDVRVIYTDLVHVMVNNYGVVINFMQGAGPNSQPIAVSRIGMSKEHAYSLLNVLQETLEKSSEPKQIKQLPAPKKSKKEKES
ncbi:MAG: helix-turn-helix domain-containing protein [Candidatus Saccharimonadales bacterium]